MNIKNYIREELNKARGHLGVYYENLVTKEKLKVINRGADLFEAASVIKLWIMSCLFEEAEKGAISFDQKIVLKDEDMVPAPGIPDYYEDKKQGRLTGDMFPESGILNYLHPGLEFTVKDLMRMMILISENTATNILIDLLGIDRINRHIRSLGGRETVLKRKLFDTSPGAFGKENMISLSETADYYRKMYRGELVSPEASAEMCALLQNQQNTYKLPFYIRQYPIAHKTGEDTGIENDCGIVFSDEPFIFCFMANEADEPEAVRLCQDIAEALTYMRQTGDTI